MAEVEEGVSVALAFLDKVAEAEQSVARHGEIEQFYSQISQFKAFSQLREFAASQGYEFSKEDLDRAMKIVMDRQLAEAGIPEWILLRMGSPSHD